MPPPPTHTSPLATNRTAVPCSTVLCTADLRHHLRHDPLHQPKALGRARFALHHPRQAYHALSRFHALAHTASTATRVHAAKKQGPIGLSEAEREKQSALKAELFDLLGDGSSGTNRMARVKDSRKRLETVVAELCLLNPTESTVDSPLLLGRWQLLTTFKPGTADVDFFRHVL